MLARLDLSGVVIGLTMTTKICGLSSYPPEPELAASATLPLAIPLLFSPVSRLDRRRYGLRRPAPSLAAGG